MPNPDLAALAKDYWLATLRCDFPQVVSHLYPGDVDKFKTNMLWCAAAMERFGENAGLFDLFGPGTELDDLRVLSPEKFLTKYLEGMFGKVPSKTWEKTAATFKAGPPQQTGEDQAMLTYSYKMSLGDGLERFGREIHFNRINGSWYVMMDPGVRRMADSVRGKVEDFTQREAKDRKVSFGEDTELEPFALWGYKDEKGWTVLEPRFAAAGKFSSGLAPVKFFKKWGYITSDGQTAIAPRFDKAEVFSEKLAAVAFRNDSLDLVWGYIGLDGKIVIKPRFESAEEFSDGQAEVTVKEGGKVQRRLVDRIGKFIQDNREFPPDDED